MEDFFVCKPRSKATLYDFMSHEKTALKALQKPKSALSTQMIPGSNPMVQTLLHPWGKICPMEVQKASLPMGQNLPTSNTDTEYNNLRKNNSREYARRFHEKFFVLIKNTAVGKTVIGKSGDGKTDDG